MQPEPKEIPCRVCGEPTLGQSWGPAPEQQDNVCRECAIDQAFEDTRCAECGRLIWADTGVTLGLTPYDHADACVSGAPERAEWAKRVADSGGPVEAYEARLGLPRGHLSGRS